MSHKNKTPLVDQVSYVLGAQFELGQGRSKHDDKAAGVTGDKIYSYSTVQTYTKHDCYFVKWVHDLPKAKQDLGHKPRTLAECRPYADKWLESRSGMSPYTQKLEAAALGKLYGEPSTNFRRTDSRTRDGITRSRGLVKTDRHFSEAKHRDIVDFGKSTGLRRHEMELLKGDALCYKDGKPYLHLTEGTKGGRPRYSPIIGDPERVREVVEKCRQAGPERVWDKVPSGMDEHSYRAIYAAKIYKAHARPLETLTKKEKYYCRGELKGKVFDREAMKIASRALGHNRVSVIAGHYLWALDVLDAIEKQAKKKENSIEMADKDDDNYVMMFVDEDEDEEEEDD